MSHCEKVMVKLVKLRRGTSMVSISVCLYRFPYLASAASMTDWSESVEWKQLLNLWPQGVRTASRRSVSLFRHPECEVFLTGSALLSFVFVLNCKALVDLGLETRREVWASEKSSSDRLSRTIVSSRHRFDCGCGFFTMDGRTWYLFSARSGSSKTFSNTSGVSVMLCPTVQGRRNKFGLWLAVDDGRGPDGGWGKAAGFSWVWSSSWTWVTLGLVRPLADLGLITCMTSKMWMTSIYSAISTIRF